MATLPINITATGLNDLAKLGVSIDDLMAKVRSLVKAGKSWDDAWKQAMADVKSSTASAMDTVKLKTDAASTSLFKMRQQVRDLRTAVSGLRTVAVEITAFGAGSIALAKNFQQAQIEVAGTEKRLEGVLDAQKRLNALPAFRNAADDVAMRGHLGSVTGARSAATEVARAGVSAADAPKLLEDLGRQAESIKKPGEDASAVFERVGKSIRNALSNPEQVRGLKEIGLGLTYAETQAIKAAGAFGLTAQRAELLSIIENKIESNTGKLGSSFSATAAAVADMATAWQVFQTSAFGTGFTSALTTIMGLITGILTALNNFSKAHPTIAHLIGLFAGWVGVLALVAGGVLGVIVVMGQLFIAIGAVQVAFADATAAGGILEGLGFSALLASLGAVAAAVGAITLAAGLTAIAIRDAFRVYDLKQAEDQVSDVAQHPEWGAAKRMAKLVPIIKRMHELGETDNEGAATSAYQRLANSPEGKRAIAADPTLSLPGNAAARAAAINNPDAAKKATKAAAAAQGLTDRENAARLMNDARERAAAEKEAAREEGERIKEARREARERDHESLRTQLEEFEDTHKRVAANELKQWSTIVALTRMGFTDRDIMVAQKVQAALRRLPGHEDSLQYKRGEDAIRDSFRAKDDGIDRTYAQQLHQLNMSAGLEAAQGVAAARYQGASGKNAAVTRLRAQGDWAVASSRYSAHQDGAASHSGSSVTVPVKLVIENPGMRAARKGRR